jgi:VWFA-related protein
MRRLLLGPAVVALALASVLAAVLVAQQQPTFRSGVEVVAVDVRVVDSTGRPVWDLRPGDFVVTVDGRPRTLVTADFISYPVTAVAARPTSVSESAAVPPSFSSNEAPSARGRTVVLVADEENIRAGYGKWAGDAAGRFVDRMQPEDRIGLLIPRSQIRVAPTTDHAVVKAGLSRVVGHMAHTWNGPAQACDGVYGKLTPPDGGRTSARPQFDGGAKAVVDDMRDRAINTLRSLVVLLESLQTEPGPKTIVLISEELPVCDQVAAQADFKHEYGRVSEAAARARAMLYVMQLDRPVADAEDPQRASQNWQSQSSRDRDIRSSGLETVVSVTGGRRLLVSGIPDAPLARIALEISGQYVLGIRTEPADRDGKTHRIKVTVKRKGVDVRARQTFTYTAVAGQPGSSAPPAGAPDASASPAPPTAAPPSPAPAAPPSSAADAQGVPVSPGSSSTGAQPSVTPDIQAVLERARRYLDEYVGQLSLLIGVERYTQWVTTSGLGAGFSQGGDRPSVRNTVSEFALVRVKDDWLGYRDVVEVDGKPVRDRQDRLQQLFLQDHVPCGLFRIQEIRDIRNRHSGTGVVAHRTRAST